MSLTQACKLLLNAFSFLASVEFAEFHTIKACSEVVLTGVKYNINKQWSVYMLTQFVHCWWWCPDCCHLTLCWKITRMWSSLREYRGTVSPDTEAVPDKPHFCLARMTLFQSVTLV